MARKNSDSYKLNTLRVQITLIRIATLVIPVYLLILSPTSGLFGVYVSQNYSLLTSVMYGFLPALAMATFGVLKESNRSLGVAGVIIALPIIANTQVQPYFTIIDFTLLLFFLEVSTTLTSFSNIAVSIKLGEEESVSYNYRLALGEYLIRIVAIIVATLLISFAAVFLTLNLSAPIGVPGMALLTTIALLVAFATLASRYRGR
jgi:hypothetical protein